MKALIALAGIVAFAAVCLLIRDGINRLFGWHMKLTLTSPKPPSPSPSPAAEAAGSFMAIVFTILMCVGALFLFVRLIHWMWYL
jgi:hypothetical protein